MAARCGQAADRLVGIGGPGLVGETWPLAPCARGLLAVEDELLGSLVDGDCAAEPGGASDSEVMQRALDVTGHIPGRPSAGCRLRRRPSAARRETAAGMTAARALASISLGAPTVTATSATAAAARALAVLASR